MKRTIRTAGLILGITALAGAAVGQSVPTADVRGEGGPRFDATQIVFKPGAGHVGLTLSVSGPDGYQLQEKYEPGVSPTFSVRDLSDGLYSYELRIVPALIPDESRGSTAGRVELPSSREGNLRREDKRPQNVILQSGHFRIEAGSLVLRDLVERGGEAPLPELERTDQTGLATKDVCYADDLIVDGSLCVGFDCPCNYSFGFDTIVLKENNLRIFFDDTSTAAAFPRNDWRIVINDSANGGASYFGIEDSTGGRRVFTIEAGARSHSLYVDDGGRVGIRTSTPSVELHVKDGDTPTLRLEQDGSSGFAPQTWDVAGNETNFFIRDVTHGSTLPFRIQPGAPSSALTVRADGRIGIGTWSPDAGLDIEADGPIVRFTNTGSAGDGWEIFMNGNTGRFNLRDTGTSNIPFKLDPGANSNLLQIGVVAANRVDINGNLVVSGTITPDFVFGSGYQLESIEEHAEYMWINGHLPAVGAATIRPDGSHAVNVGARSQSMLEELEKAHIYIEQLHATVRELKIEQLQAKARESQIEQLQATVRELLNRLERLEKDTID